MGRRTRPPKGKAKPKRSLVRTPPMDDGAKVHDLEQRLVDALDQHKATAEILRLISGAPTELQPALDAIAKNAALMCDAYDAVVFLREGDRVRYAAHYGPITITLQRTTLSRDSITAAAILDRRLVHVHDVLASEPPAFPLSAKAAREGGFRTALSVPLLRESEAIGALAIRRREVQPFTDQQITFLRTFADQAVIAIENARLFTELQARNRELTEALAQQTATAEILRVISTSPTDLQPVLEAVVRSAARFCGADDAELFRLDGDHLALAAHHGPIPAPVGRPLPVVQGSVSGRAFAERRAIHVADLQAETHDFPVTSAMARELGFRASLSVPLLREGLAVGAITLRRAEVHRFTDKQISLLQTFADQAVIAIENVRLFTELQEKNEALTQAHAQVSESLEQQTATAEILRVISSSPTDVTPVLDRMAESATRFCLAHDATIWRLEGDHLVVVAHHGPLTAPIGHVAPNVAGTVVGRSVLERQPVHILDLQAEREEFPEGSANARRFGHRTILSVPLLREGGPLGAITLRRSEVAPFTAKQIALLLTFADQAVIAIENVRLFTELQTSNRELTAALDTQTATSDILRVISRTHTDVQPVFDAIMASAARLLRAHSGALTRIVDSRIGLAAMTTSEPLAEEALRANFPMSLDSGTAHALALRMRAPLNVIDADTDPRLIEATRRTARSRGYRSQLVMPILRQDEAIGTISLTRREPGGFTDDEIALLQTFADQAVIAIENARLLTELQSRTEELTRSVGELRALGEVGRAIGSTLDLHTVLTTIVARATELAGADAGVIYEYDAAREIFERRATECLEAEIVQALVATPIRRGQGVTGRLESVRAPIQQIEIRTSGEQLPVRDALIQAGYRSLLAVPLLHEDRLVGGLTVFRRTSGEFAGNVVELLQTFATQSALAIQNARLFREIEIKSRELEVASQHKSEFLASMSHELRTPLNAIIGYSELLEEEAGDVDAGRLVPDLQKIATAAKHQLSLINDILDLSKIEAGRMELELADFDLRSAIENALILVRERASRRGIALTQSVGNGIGVVRADERKVKQVLLNLLSNALKFTPEGGRVDITAAVNGRMVEVSVADTGIGIAPEDQEVVFEEFRQVGTAEKKAEGTGLGLALSRKFVELHGGRMWVQSRVGKGSAFTFSLPADIGS